MLNSVAAGQITQKFISPKPHFNVIKTDEPGGSSIIMLACTTICCCAVEISSYLCVCVCLCRFLRPEPVPRSVRSPVPGPLLPHGEPLLQSSDALPGHLHLHPARHLWHVAGKRPLPHLPAAALPGLDPKPERALPDQQHALSLLRRFLRLLPVLHGPRRRPFALADDPALH